MVPQTEKRMRIQFDHSKLRGRIVELYGTNKVFATKINKTEQTVTAKLTGKSGFSQDDIVEWSDALNIENTDIGIFYFTLKV